VITTPSGLNYADLRVGDGPAAEPGKRIVFHYTGWLKGGTRFDSSLDRGEPHKFVLDNGEVIKGWDEGMRGMKPGGKRRLIIPPNLAYGSRGSGDGLIPPDSTLIYDVEVLMIQSRK
jgi:FKBP-type peptidyl-prolyl cis-trans isomerase